MRRLWISAAFLVCASGASADWRDAGAPGVATRELARTPEGRSVVVTRIAAADAEHPDRQPAVLVIAGIDARHAIGREAAGSLVRTMSEGEALAGRTLYVVEDLNPDGSARFAKFGRDGLPTADTGRAPDETPRDADRDRRFAEDGGDDLNDDGMITLMRLRPVMGYDLAPTHVIDAEDPRVMRERGPGEAATHVVMIEGTDNDGDGLFNEDGYGGTAGGGIDLDMHFPIEWPEHADGAGWAPLTRPEARGLVDWMLTRDNIVAVVVYGERDNLWQTPATNRFDVTRRVPLGIEAGDKAAYDAVGERYREITGVRGFSGWSIDGSARGVEGSLMLWTYADFGALTFATPVYVRPDLVRREPARGEAERDEAADGERTGASERSAADDAQDEPRVVEIGGYRVEMTPEGVRAAMARLESADAEEQTRVMAAFQALPSEVRSQMTALAQQEDGEAAPPAAAPLAGEGESRGRQNAGAPAGGGSGESAWAKWLAVADEQGRGFVEWRSFDHPQLGEVEIGGFEPGFMQNPPEGMREALFEQQASLVSEVLDRLPSLNVADASAERIGSGLVRVRVRLVNEGRFATRSAIASKSRRLAPTVLAIETEPERVVSGSRVVRFESVEPGGHAQASWLVRQDGPVRVELRDPVFGWMDIEIDPASGRWSATPKEARR
ncbi:MAG: hypothetical protein EA378_07720 [Phycisphaerales bacterium]|nr:MAG: hypothetical protein EA378_07720 [Phycisphaerales bacterium]